MWEIRSYLVFMIAICSSSPLNKQSACQTSPVKPGCLYLGSFQILAAGIVLVIVRLIISSITQECAWETRKKALFWQLSTPGARSQAPLQAHPLLLGLGYLTLCFSCVYLALSTKKKRFVFRIRHFDHLICLFPQNTSRTSWSEKLWTFYDKKLWHWKKSTILYANSNSKFLLWNNLQMITINVLNRSDPSDPSEKNTKMYSKNIYFVLCILQIHYIFMYLVKIPCNCTCIHNWYM